MLPSLAAVAIQGDPLPAGGTFSIAVMSMCVISFVCLTIRRFNREEF
jgi:hypothetical protein